MKTQLKNKKVMILIVSLLIVICVFLGGFLFYSSNLKPASDTSKAVDFEIKQGDTMNTVIGRLESENLIKNATVAKIYVKLHSLNELKAGNFVIDPSWDTGKILAVLNDAQASRGGDVTITFKEGMWAKDVAKLIEDKLGLKQKDLLALWNDDTYLKELMKKYPFLTKDILNARVRVKLEGYLFPQTYAFPKDADEKEVTEIFLNHFQKVYDSYAEDIKKSKYSLQELITLASMVQYEASSTHDMEMIAGVFENRLRLGMTLDSSVTVCYALYDDMTSGEDCEVNTHIDSPYNTYKNPGLPIGPILNPGEDAIKAVLHPKDNDYLYFVADIYGDGKVYYAKTLEEQEANIDKYNLRR